MPVPTKIIKKTGHIAELCIMTEGDPMKTYFSCIVTEGGINSGVNPQEFIFKRNIIDSVDHIGENETAVNYASIPLAIIATIKDAYIWGKRIIIEGYQDRGQPTQPARIKSVCIKERTQPYYYRLADGAESIANLGNNQYVLTKKSNTKLNKANKKK